MFTVRACDIARIHVRHFVNSRYKWLFYVNPNFYGFTAVSRVLLEDYRVSCPYESTIECYPSSALYILSYFSLDTINPYLNTVVSLHERTYVSYVVANEEIYCVYNT